MSIYCQTCERGRCRRQAYGPYTNQKISLVFHVVSMTLMFCIVFIFACAQPSFAYEIATPFGALYGEEGHRHLGADVINIAQPSIVAPVAGTVSFCGKVPKADGQRVFALTLKTSDDHLVSLSPLKDVGVSRGEAIKKGQVLGALAAFGDPSLDAPHLHVSLRIQKKYVDPCDVIAPAIGEAVQGGSVVRSSVLKESAEAHVKPHTEVKAMMVRTKVNEAVHSSSAQVPAAHSVKSARTQTDCSVSSALTVLKERALSHARPVSNLGNIGSAHMTSASSMSGERYVTKHFPSLSQVDIAGILFLVGLTLTLAGWGGYTLLDGKFDIARKLEQLAVRGQR